MRRSNRKWVWQYDTDEGYRETVLEGLHSNRIGVIADTHDKSAIVEAAIDRFARAKCSCVIHLGDIIKPSTLMQFAALPRRTCFGWIHGDHETGKGGDYEFLQEVSQQIGAICLSSPQKRYDKGGQAGLLRVNQWRFGLVHSTYKYVESRTQIKEWSISKNFDFVLYGHVHYFNLKFPSTDSPTVLFNPGGLYREPFSICVLDCDRFLVNLYSFMRGRFVHAATIDLRERILYKGYDWPAYAAQVEQMAYKEQSYWRKDNDCLDSHGTDWMRIADFLAGNRAI